MHDDYTVEQATAAPGEKREVSACAHRSVTARGDGPWVCDQCGKKLVICPSCGAEIVDGE